MKRQGYGDYKPVLRPWEDLPWWISWHIVQELMKERRT